MTNAELKNGTLTFELDGYLYKVENVYINNMQQMAHPIEVTTFGRTSREYITGFSNIEITLKGSSVSVTEKGSSVVLPPEEVINAMRKIRY